LVACWVELTVYLKAVQKARTMVEKLVVWSVSTRAVKSGACLVEKMDGAMVAQWAVLLVNSSVVCWVVDLVGVKVASKVVM